ncbi:MAG: DUF5606 domain-containing protein [Bacteroidetes bacterium]|nr:DUF5606 domain-containing protein [Bacteroidota bacterium]
MDITKVISISGMPGLYKVIGQSKSGVIVESLTDKKRFPAFGSSKISSLDDISIYTTGEDMPLKEVLKKLMEKEKSEKCPDVKSLDEKSLRDYISSFLPEYDKERVHLSDLKKLLTWYNLLHDSGLLTAEEPTEEEKLSLSENEKKNLNAGKKDLSGKSALKTNAPHVKVQGVRKTGTA